MAPVLSVARLVGVLLLAPRPHADSLSNAPVQGAWTSERELLAHLRKSGLEDELALLRLCISRSWWTAAREVVALTHVKSAGSASSTSSSSFTPVREEVTALLREVKRSADDFGAYADAAYRGQTKGLDEVHCAVQWAQNSTTVFLGIKYAARWSAPGAIEVVDVKVNISSCCFELEGFGHHSNIRKRYVADLPLYADLVPQQSSWSAASVGRLTATLQKASASAWPRLTKRKGKDASKHQIGKWLDMQERWEEDIAASAKKDKKSKPSPSPPKKADKDKSRKGRLRFDEAYALVRKRIKHFWRQLQRWIKKPAKYSSQLLTFAGFVLSSTMLLVTMIRWLCLSPAKRREGSHTPKASEASTSERAADSAEARLTAEQAASGETTPALDAEGSDDKMPPDHVEEPVAPNAVDDDDRE